MLKPGIHNREAFFKVRLDVEQAVIGAVLIASMRLEGYPETGYAEVKQVLNPQNFKVYEYLDHQKVWQALGEMWEQRIPIDLITVTHYLHRHGESRALLAHSLSTLTNRISSNAHLEYHAFILLEYDIMEKFCDLLLSIGSRADNAVHKAAVMDCYENMCTLDFDLFDGLQTCKEYLTKIELEELLLQELNEFMSAFEKKVEFIKDKHLII